MTINSQVNKVITATPTAGTIPLWDANVNLSANNFVPSYATTVTAAGTTVLTAGSPYYQFFTGSTTQIVTLPVASTLTEGASFYFVNNSSGNVTINSSGGNAVQVMVAGTSALITCILNSGTTAASWFSDYAFNGGEGSGTVNSGTTGQLAYYASTGVAVSGISTTNLPLITPLITTGIKDANGNVVIGLVATASAVNSINIANNSTGHPVQIAAIGSDTNIILQLQGKGTSGAQLQGRSNAVAVPAGYLGETISSVVLAASAVSMANNTNKDVTTISVTAGKWAVYGNILFQSSVAATDYQCWVSLTTASYPDLSSITAIQGGALGATVGGLTAPYLDVNVSSNTTIYLSGLASFASGTTTACGRLYAVRVG